MTEIHLTDLQTEHATAPIGLWTARPRFSWKLTGPDDLRQSGYQFVLTGPDGVVIDTGRVDSTQSVLVDPLTTDLASATTFEWRVRVWTSGRDDASDWTETSFETAVFEPWTAPWVEPVQDDVVIDGAENLWNALTPTELPPAGERLHPVIMLRQSFTLEHRPVRARLRATAQGVYAAELNGAVVGDQVLAPGYESYHTALSAQTYDVTDLLVDGDNVLGFLLGDGWYAGRISVLGRSGQYGDRLRASWQLELDHADGSRQLVHADENVVSTLDGPIRYADLFIGERHDARRTLTGWSSPAVGGRRDDVAWTPVSHVRVDTPVRPFVGEPVRRVDEFAARQVIITPAGETVIDFGQVIAGRVRLHVQGPAGTEITLEHGETLDEAGNYLNNILGVNKDQADSYVLRGDAGGETWEPLFAFHGFRYVRVTGWPGTLDPADVTAVVISSDVRQLSEWTSSDERLNQLHHNVIWSQRANFLAVPTDCPQRERAGWTGDLQIFAAAASTNADISLFMDRWLTNVRADQQPDGCVPVIVPMPPAMAASLAELPSDPMTISELSGPAQLEAIRGAAGWGDAITIAPLILWQHFADPHLLSDNYPAMQAWVERQRVLAAEQNPARLRDVELDDERRARLSLLWNGEPNFGDWLAPSTVDAADPSSFFNAPRLTGELVGAAFGAQSLTLIAETAEIHGRDADARDYRERAQTVRDAFAAEYLSDDGLLPTDLQGPYVLALAFDLVPAERRRPLVDRLVQLITEHGDRLDTGFVSVPYLLDVLYDHGHADLARRVLWQSEYPSWLYEVDRGATTIWEAWDAIRPDGTVGSVSFNHYAFGCVDDVLFRRLAGLCSVEPGYRQSSITPDLDAPLDQVAAGIETPYGRLASSWKRTSSDQVRLELTVPANTSSSVLLPAGWHSGDPLTELGSGTHQFTATRR